MMRASQSVRGQSIVRVLAWVGLALSVCSTSRAQPSDAGPFIERTEQTEWIVNATVLTGFAQRGCESIEGRPGPSAAHDLVLPGLLGNDQGLAVEQGVVFWPLADRAASYKIDAESLRGKLHSNGFELPATQTIVGSGAAGVASHSNARYGQWTFKDVARFGPTFKLEVTFAAKTWNTVFDEEAAREVAWPIGDWPDEAASTFESMLFVDRDFQGDYTASRTADLVQVFTRGQQRNQPPVVAAKWVAGQIATRFQTTGDFAVPDTRPIDTQGLSGAGVARAVKAIEAVAVSGVETTSSSFQGSPVDLPLLLTAVYREMGLPARLVVGYVPSELDRFFTRERSILDAEEGLYAWVEFALYDETQSSLSDALTWVPVDILAIRENNTGRQSLDQPWEGFGSSERLGSMIPLAYHLHPHRLGAVSYGFANLAQLGQGGRGSQNTLVALPSLWGWNLAPRTPPGGDQVIWINATSQSRTIENNEEVNPNR